ncbi:MAG: Na(+)-translocating NADH-quinone reductase subunit C [Thermoguttaceae bacterium]|nr:Na(+)-translocating NADH-quinone reductase subunit C [Thermoguttaceae bacterium]
MKDSILKTFTVATLLCIVCSVLVAMTATGLKPNIEKNALLDKQLNVLRAAGLAAAGEKISAARAAELFGQIEQVVVDLASGTAAPDADPAKVDLAAQLKDPNGSVALAASDDPAGVKRLPNEMVVYLVRGADGALGKVVLPIYGQGLWSVMYGFLTLEGDLKTVADLSFYDHGETPGLGGEISNPSKMGKWSGKSAFDESGKPAVHFVKGTAAPDDPYQVDGLSGATLTSNGVNRTVDFWLGERGYGRYLATLK